MSKQLISILTNFNEKNTENLRHFCEHGKTQGQQCNEPKDWYLQIYLYSYAIKYGHCRNLLWKLDIRKTIANVMTIKRTLRRFQDFNIYD